MSDSANPSYLNQLDGLRALAVISVFAQHWLPESVMSELPFGYVGVRLFFVLSGFLITGILLRCRSHINNATQSLGYTAKAFFTRRILRIFPLYYAVLVLALILNFDNARSTAFFHLTYLSNVNFAIAGKWGPVSHFWSLAVEEQFYLFWPWVVWLTPRRHLRILTATLILTSILYRAAGVAFEWNRWMIDYQLISCMDALCLGALLADLDLSGDWKFIRTKIFSTVFAGSGLVMMTVIFTTHMFKTDHTFRLVFLSLASSMASFVIIGYAARGIPGRFGSFLQSPPMSYLGKISYGLYVIHPFSPLCVRLLGLHQPNNTIFSFLLNSTIAIIAASISWILLENPINQLKKFFPYKRPSGMSNEGMNLQGLPFIPPSLNADKIEP